MPENVFPDAFISSASYSILLPSNVSSTKEKTLVPYFSFNRHIISNTLDIGIFR